MEPIPGLSSGKSLVFVFCFIQLSLGKFLFTMLTLFCLLFFLILHNLSWSRFVASASADTGLVASLHTLRTLVSWLARWFDLKKLRLEKEKTYQKVTLDRILTCSQHLKRIFSDLVCVCGFWIGTGNVMAFHPNINANLANLQLLWLIVTSCWGLVRHYKAHLYYSSYATLHFSGCVITILLLILKHSLTIFTQFKRL